MPVLDIVAVAAGFVLRAIAGAAATDVPISEWFFIVTVVRRPVHGRRQARGRAPTCWPTTPASVALDARRVLAATYLAYLRAVASGVRARRLLPVGLRVGRRPSRPDAAIWFQLSIVPVRHRHPALRPAARPGRGRRARAARPDATGRCCSPARAGPSSTPMASTSPEPRRRPGAAPTHRRAAAGWGRTAPDGRATCSRPTSPTRARGAPSPTPPTAGVIARGPGPQLRRRRPERRRPGRRHHRRRRASSLDRRRPASSRAERGRRASTRSCGRSCPRGFFVPGHPGHPLRHRRRRDRRRHPRQEPPRAAGRGATTSSRCACSLPVGRGRRHRPATATPTCSGPPPAAWASPASCSTPPSGARRSRPAASSVDTDRAPRPRRRHRR